jgi:hypothetical protein
MILVTIFMLSLRFFKIWTELRTFTEASSFAEARRNFFTRRARQTIRTFLPCDVPSNFLTDISPYRFLLFPEDLDIVKGRHMLVFFFSFFFFSYSCCSHLEQRTSVKRFVSLQFLNPRQSLLSLGRGISLSQDRHLTQTQTEHKQTSTPWVGFEPMILVFERAKTLHALNCAVTVIGLICL